LTETVSVAGVVADAGETLSQFLPPEVVDAAAVKETAAPVLETETLCGAGDAVPKGVISHVKLSDAGFAVSWLWDHADAAEPQKTTENTKNLFQNISTPSLSWEFLRQVAPEFFTVRLR